MHKPATALPSELAAILSPSIPVYALSPHIDDAIWSAGGFLYDLAANGYEVHLVSIFSHSIYVYDTIRPPAEATIIRKAEDYDAARTAGMRSVNFLDFPDGILRDTPQARVINPDYVSPPYLLEMLTDCLQRSLPQKSVLFVPAGFGGHMDHLTTRRAAAALPQPKLLYRDMPYGARDIHNERAAEFLHDGWRHASVPLPRATAEKHMQLFWLYRSQTSTSVADEIGSYLRSNGLDIWFQ